MPTSLLRTGLVGAALVLLPLGAAAQTGGTGDFFTASAGAREFTFGASGATNRDFDDSFGGVNFSIGQYLNPTTLIVLRQTLDYTNPDVGDNAFAGSTRFAVDWHFAGNDQFRPFAGVNLGGIYGEDVEETWAAGLELGGKYYVKPATFVFALIEYSWLFDDADDVEDRFDDGAIFWNAGIGFNF